MAKQESKQVIWRLLFRGSLVLGLAMVLQSGDVIGGDLLDLWHRDWSCSAGCSDIGCDCDPLDPACCDGCSYHKGTCLDFEGCCGSRFKLTEFNIYPTFSYLDDVGATYNEFACRCRRSTTSLASRRTPSGNCDSRSSFCMTNGSKWRCRANAI